MSFRPTGRVDARRESAPARHPGPGSGRRGITLASALVVATLVLFALAMIGLIAAPLSRPRVETFAPSVPTTADDLRERGDTDTLTIDARHEQAWVFVDLVGRRIVSGRDAAGGWDLAVRRYALVPRIGAVDLGPVPFDATVESAGHDLVRSRFDRDTLNEATQRWYRYGWTSHLLLSRGNVYLVPLHDGSSARIQVVSYYCPEVRAGCLTIRWRLTRARAHRAQLVRHRRT